MEKKKEKKREKEKFYIDLSGEKKASEDVRNLLKVANQKDYGREILFKDLAMLGICKISSEDIEQLQKKSLSEMEKVEIARAKFNQENQANLTLGEFLVRELEL